MIKRLDQYYPFKVYDTFLKREQIRVMTGADFVRLLDFNKQYHSGVWGFIIGEKLIPKYPPEEII